MEIPKRTTKCGPEFSAQIFDVYGIKVRLEVMGGGGYIEEYKYMYVYVYGGYRSG